MNSHVAIYVTFVGQIQILTNHIVRWLMEKESLYAMDKANPHGVQEYQE
jgi:hypothetical protein